MFAKLVSQRFAGCQHVLYPGHCLFFLPEIDKRLPFEIENNFFIDEAVGPDIAAADDIGDPFGQEHVVFADVLGGLHVEQLRVDHSLGCGTEGLDFAFHRRGVPLVHHLEDFFLGFSHKVITVEDNPILRPEKTVGPGFGRGHGDLGHADGHERGYKVFGQVDIGDRFRNIRGHLLPQIEAAAAAGQQADADFHQPHVKVGMGHDLVGTSQANLAATTQGHAIGCGHNRKAGIPGFLHTILGLFEEGVDLGIFAFLGQAGHKGQIAAGGEGPRHAAGLVADHQSGPVGVHIVQPFRHEIHDFAVDGVHFGVKFQAEDVVADIHERCRPAGLDNVVRGLQPGQGDNVVTDDHVFVAAAGEIVEGDFAALGFIKRGVAGSKQGLDVLRHGQPVGFHFGHRLFKPDGVPGLEGAHFEVEAPFHGIVDFNDSVGNFRDPVGRID